MPSTGGPEQSKPAQVAYGSSAQGKRERAEAAAIAFAEIMRLDPGMAAHLDQVRQSSTHAHAEEDAEDLVLAGLKRLQAVTAEKEKGLGNTALKSGDVAAAWSHYTEAVRLAPDQAHLLTNRAAAALKLNKKQVARIGVVVSGVYPGVARWGMRWRQGFR